MQCILYIYKYTTNGGPPSIYSGYWSVSWTPKINSTNIVEVLLGFRDFPSLHAFIHLFYSLAGVVGGWCVGSMSNTSLRLLRDGGGGGVP